MELFTQGYFLYAGENSRRRAGGHPIRRNTADSPAFAPGIRIPRREQGLFHRPEQSVLRVRHQKPSDHIYKRYARGAGRHGTGVPHHQRRRRLPRVVQHQRRRPSEDHPPKQRKIRHGAHQHHLRRHDAAARCPAGDRMDRHRRAGALPVHAQCGGFPLDHLQRPALQPFEARACALRRPRTQPVGGHQGRRIIAHPQLLRQKDLRRSPCRTENHGQQRSAGQLGLHFRRKQPQPAVDRHRRRRAELLLLCRPKDPPPRRPRGDAVHPHAARDGAGHPVGGFGRLRYIPHHARRIADPS